MGRLQGAALALGARISGERRIPAKMKLEGWMRSGAGMGTRMCPGTAKEALGDRSGGEGRYT